LAKSLDLSLDQGVLITGLLQGGPAHKAGMRPGDIITQINHQPIHNTDNLLNLVSELNPDSIYPILVIRDKKPLQLNVQVSVRPVPKKQD